MRDLNYSRTEYTLMPSSTDNNLPPARLSWQLAIRLKRDTQHPTPSAQSDNTTPPSQRYDVELLLDNPASQGMSSPVSGEAEFNLRELAKLRLNLDKYGQALATALFRDPQIRDRYRSALKEAATAEVDLRITLFIDPSAPELHALAWELLCDPDSGARVTNNQATPFSRFLYTGDFPPIPRIRKEAVRALIAVPNPSDIESSGTAKIDVLQQIEFAAAALKGLAVSVLCKTHDGPEQDALALALQKFNGTVIPEAVTVDNLLKAIAKGVDLLFLVCHGHVIVPSAASDAAHFKSGFGPDLAAAIEHSIASPVLWLENDARELVAVPGGEFARKLADLGQRPGVRLAVLASCESAGIEADDSGVSAQAALAPRLAQAGVPTIVAMQGKISMGTAAQFMESFLAQVALHGFIDRAMAAARGNVRHQPDCWMPALFSRLKNGTLWYEAGFRGAATSSIQSIADQLVANKCTPFVGWGLAEKIYGSKAETSRRLANDRLVPFFPQRKGELALVSQYLYTTTRSDETTINQVKASMLEQMKANLGDRLSGEFEGIGDVFRYIYDAKKTQSPDPFKNELEALRTIARLPSTVFINACPDRLLEEALLAEDKTPITLSLQWKKNVVPEVDGPIIPTVTNPLLIHVFGRFKNAENLVLWEDDYLNFLMGIAQNQELIPSAVKNAFTSNTLMFLGFSPDDWSFRVLFRVVKFLLSGAGAQQELKPNIAVQVEPDGTLFTGPDEANYYLEKFYFPANVEPYWGTSSDFLTDLWPVVDAGLKKKRRANAD